MAVLSRAVFGLTAKVFNARVPVSAAVGTILFSFVNLLLTLAVSPFLGGISFDGIGDLWVPVIVTTVAAAIGNMLYFTGQRRLDAGTAQIAFSSIVVWGTMLSVAVLGSRFSWLQLVGIGLLLGAIVLAQYRKGARRLDVGVMFIMASAVSFAAFQVESAVISKEMSIASYLIIAYVGSFVLPLVVYCRSLLRELAVLRRLPRNRTVRVTLIASAMTLLYNATAFFAYREAPDSGVVVVLLTTQTLIAVVLGIIFLRERDHVRRKLGAGAIAVAAAIMIKS